MSPPRRGSSTTAIPTPATRSPPPTYSLPSTGTLVGNADGSFSYTPPATYTGMASFKYLARDNWGVSSKTAGWVSISVRANKAPVTVDDTVSSAANTALGHQRAGQRQRSGHSDRPCQSHQSDDGIHPATGKPNQGGTVSVNWTALSPTRPGSTSPAPRCSCTAVKDTYNPAAISKAAYVRVNVQ